MGKRGLAATQMVTMAFMKRTTIAVAAHSVTPNRQPEKSRCLVDLGKREPRGIFTTSPLSTGVMSFAACRGSTRVEPEDARNVELAGLLRSSGLAGLPVGLNRE